MELLRRVGSDQMFVECSLSSRQACFTGGSKRLNYIFLSVGSGLVMVAGYVYSVEKFSLLFGLLMFFSIVLFSSGIRNLRSRYDLIMDFKKRQLVLKVGNRKGEFAEETTAFSMFDGLRIETKIRGGDTSISTSVFVSLVKDGQRICFLANRINGFKSEQEAARFAQKISKYSLNTLQVVE